MAKIKFTHFIPREKPKKRKGVHKKLRIKMRRDKRSRQDTRVKGDD